MAAYVAMQLVAAAVFIYVSALTGGDDLFLIRFGTTVVATAMFAIPFTLGRPDGRGLSSVQSWSLVVGVSGMFFGLGPLIAAPFRQPSYYLVGAASVGCALVNVWLTRRRKLAVLAERSHQDVLSRGAERQGVPIDRG